jgi:integrase
MLDFIKIEFGLMSAKKRKVRIYIFLHLSKGKKLSCPLPLFINPSFWQDKNQQVSPRYKEAEKINEKLKIVRFQLERTQDLERIRDNKSLKLIIKDISINYLLNNNLRIICAIANQIKTAPYRKNRKTGSIGLRLNTIKRYSYLLKLIKEYEIEKDTLLFIDYFKIQDIDAFSSYLLHEKSYGVGTVGKQLGLIKTVLIRAKRDGYPVSSNYQFIDSFGLDKQKRILQTLDLEEIELIKKATLPLHLINSWKWMLIGLYTGQRVADLLSLKPDQLREGPNDILYIDFVQQKTGRAVTVGILDPLIKSILLEKFPNYIYSQLFNMHIKQICKIAGITKRVTGYKMHAKPRRKLKGVFKKYELITAHDLRRSFATNYYSKVETPILMRITGHKKESTFLEYIGENFNQDHYADLFIQQISS